jgi:hypothetical protein
MILDTFLTLKKTPRQADLGFVGQRGGASRENATQAKRGGDKGGTFF